MDYSCMDSPKRWEKCSALFDYRQVNVVITVTTLAKCISPVTWENLYCDSDFHCNAKMALVT